MFSFTRLALVAAVIPLVAATNCNKGSFYYSNTARCIPENGNNTPDAGTAPAGVSCPQGSWYWSKGMVDKFSCLSLSLMASPLRLQVLQPYIGQPQPYAVLP